MGTPTRQGVMDGGSGRGEGPEPGRSSREGLRWEMGSGPQEAEENLEVLKSWNGEATAVVQGTKSALNFSKEQLTTKTASARRHETVLLGLIKSIGNRR